VRVDSFPRKPETPERAEIVKGRLAQERGRGELRLPPPRIFEGGIVSRDYQEKRLEKFYSELGIKKPKGKKQKYRIDRLLKKRKPGEPTAIP
jgi:hypothetical protein